MPTMVNLPEIVTPEVAQLRAVQRPAEQSGLSSFLLDVLPEAVKGYQAHQEENKDYNIALGRNDELNQVQRNVSFADNKYYDMGHELQKVNSTQMQQDKDFNTQIDAMVARHASADEIWDVGQKYLAQSVEMVHQSNLDTDIKKELYDADLKRQIAYQKAVSDKIKEATQQAFTFDRNNRVASLYTDVSGAKDSTEMGLKMMSYIQKGQLAYTRIGGMSAEEASKAIEQDMIAAAKFWQLQLKDPTQGNANTAAQLKEFVDQGVQSGYIPMGVASELYSTAQGVEANVMDNNGTVVAKQVAQDLFDWDVDPTTYDVTKVQDGVDKIQAYIDRGDITPEDGLRLMKQYMDYGASRQAKLLNASDKMNPTDMVTAGITQQQWVGELGNTVDSYIDNYEQYVLKQHPNDTTTAGIAMFQQAIQGDPSGLALRPLATRAGTWLSGNLLSTLNMTDADLANSENGQQRKAQYQQLAQVFQQVSKTKPDLADAMLEGFPDDKREFVRDALLNNRTIGDLRNSIANAPETNQKQAYTKDAISKMKWDDIRGGAFANLIGGNPSGVRTEIFGAQENINREFTDLLRAAATQSQRELAIGMNSNDPKQLVKQMKASGMIVPSEKWDYSSIIMPPTATAAYRQRYSLGGATQQYVARAIDTRRAEIIKQLGIEQENVLVSIDKTGKYVTFHNYGRNGDPDPRLPTVSMNLADLDKRVAKVKAEADKGKAKFKGNNSIGIMGNARIPSAPIGKVAVTINGRPTTVQYSASASVPFGGNGQLTKIMLDHWAKREGFVVSTTQSGAPAGGGQKSVPVMGLGVNMAVHSNASDGHGSTWGKRFAAAQGNPQAVMRVQSDFIAQHHADLAENLKDAHIPVPTTAPYDRRYISSVMAIADAMWLSPSTGRAMVNILNQPDLNAAMRMFGSNKALYTRQKNGQVHPRTQDFMNMIIDHYRNR